MTQPIYTLGYSGLNPVKLKTLIVHLDAVLIDIRLAARSRIPHWNQGRLEELFGASYMHVPHFGNLNYKRGGSIAIANYALGKQSIEIIRSTLKKPMLLMCACKSPDTCHRTLVASMLREDGFTVEELTPSRINELLTHPIVAVEIEAPPIQPVQGPPQQLSLFD